MTLNHGYTSELHRQDTSLYHITEDHDSIGVRQNQGMCILKKLQGDS